MKSGMKKCQGGSELFKDLSVIRMRKREREREFFQAKKKNGNEYNFKEFLMCKHSN